MGLREGYRNMGYKTILLTKMCSYRVATAGAGGRGMLESRGAAARER